MTNNRKNYRLDVDKIKTLKDVKNVLDSIRFVGYYDADDPNDENYYLSEYFTILQKPQELTFPPAPRKSLFPILWTMCAIRLINFFHHLILKSKWNGISCPNEIKKRLSILQKSVILPKNEFSFKL